MTSRSQFETRFPVPEGVTWNPETSRYVLTELRKSTVATYEAHVERWVVWQASREACVVDLMPHVTAEECAAHLQIDDDDVALDISHMINGAIIACGGMIKAAGLRVKP